MVGSTPIHRSLPQWLDRASGRMQILAASKTGPGVIQINRRSSADLLTTDFGAGRQLNGGLTDETNADPLPALWEYRSQTSNAGRLSSMSALRAVLSAPSPKENEKVNEGFVGILAFGTANDFSNDMFVVKNGYHTVYRTRGSVPNLSRRRVSISPP